MNHNYNWKTAKHHDKSDPSTKYLAQMLRYYNSTLVFVRGQGVYSLYSETSAISQFVITEMALREWKLNFLKKNYGGYFFPSWKHSIAKASGWVRCKHCGESPIPCLGRGGRGIVFWSCIVGYGSKVVWHYCTFLSRK